MSLKTIFSIIVFLIIGISCKRHSFNDNQSSINISDSINKVDSLIAQSRHYYRSNTFNDSIFDSYLQKAFELSKNNDLFTQQATICQRLGKRYRNMSSFGNALYYYEKALEIANEIGDDSIKAYTQHEMAVVFRRIDDNAKALNMHFKVLDWAESVNDTLLILSSNNGIGNVYFSYKNLEKAIEYFHKSLKILENGHNNKLSEAINANNIGEAWLELGNADSAFIYLNKSYEVNLYLDSKIGQAICKNGMGNIFFYQKKYNKAIEFYDSALELNREVGNLIYVTGNLINLGKTYFTVKNYQLAEKSLNEALDLAKQIGSKSNIVKTLQILSDVYKEESKNEFSISCLNQLIIYKDSINDELTMLNAEGMNALYRLEKQEREIVILQQKDELSQLQLNRQKILIISSVITIVGGLIFLIFVLWQRKIRIQYIDKINKQHQSIRDSIKYAEKIQSAILPDASLLKSNFSDYFILFRPRDVVSGDFYWFTKKEDLVILVTADSTGHGVPGSLMSMLGIAFLNEIVNKEGILEPNLILNRLREQIVKQLNQNGKMGESKDGMELSLFTIDTKNKKLKFSGAYNPLFIVRNNEMIQLNADKMPIGYHPKKNESFTMQEVDVFEGDCIYSTSDGYYDQFGGSDGRKLLLKTFKKLILDNHKKTMDEQHIILNTHLDAWRGKNEQIDDVIVMGIKI